MTAAAAPLWRVLVPVAAAVLAVAGVVVRVGLSDEPAAVGLYRSTSVQGGFAAEFTGSDGSPVRWNPCQPVHYVVNPAGAPVHALDDVTGALQRLADASGLSFVDDGDTAERPSQGREPYQPQRYGERWAPVLVAWAAPGSTDLPMGRGVLALAEPVAVRGPAGPQLVAAEIDLDPGSRLGPGFGIGYTQGEVLLHEWGHVLGLDHVSDPAQIMFPVIGAGVGELGSGDRAGLAALGVSGGCLTPIRPRRVRLSGETVGVSDPRA